MFPGGRSFRLAATAVAISVGATLCSAQDQSIPHAPPAPSDAAERQKMSIKNIAMLLIAAFVSGYSDNCACQHRSAKMNADAGSAEPFIADPAGGAALLGERHHATNGFTVSGERQPARALALQQQ